MINCDLVTEAQNIVNNFIETTVTNPMVLVVEENLKNARCLRLRNVVTEEEHKNLIKEQIKYLVKYYKCEE